MIILHSQPESIDRFQIVLLFGTGLIGSAVYNNINKLEEYSSSFFSFDWHDLHQRKRDMIRIHEYLLNLSVSVFNKRCAPTQIAFVWCAGRAGFSAQGKEVEGELQSFGFVIDFAARLMAVFPESKFLFHMISSAGGLFENQRLIDRQSIPEPMRCYGELKYKQENYLLKQETHIVKNIYRPTSVYGYTGPGQRMGLIPTLISNGIQNRPSIIYGDSSTLRDYVFNENIGAYISQSLFNASLNGKTNIHLLASGKPSSIFEIQHFVEQVIGKKIYLNFHSTAETENTRDITVNSSALPADWSPTDIKIGIRYVKDMLISGNSIKFPNKIAVSK